MTYVIEGEGSDEREGAGRVVGVWVKRTRALRSVRTAVDAKLMARSGIDEFSIRRVRSEFQKCWAQTSYGQRLCLVESGICLRFRWMTELLRSFMSESNWQLWLAYIEHAEADIEEMCQGEYPISPYIVRLHSALLGIKVEFLLVGDSPSCDRHGADIDAYPATATRG